MEFFINLILQLLGWNCSVLNLVRIEQVVRKLDGNTYVVIFNDFARITSYLSFYLKKLEIKEHLSVAVSDSCL